MQLKRRLSEPGFIVSAVVHVGALAATLVAFSQTPKFDDLQETVPVEIVTDNQFNQIMKGDKSAKEVRPDAPAQTEQAAAADPTPPTPTPPTPAPPPPPPPPPPPVKQVQQPKPPAPTPPPPPVAVLPPPRPEEPQDEQTPDVPTPPIRDVAADAELPKPVPKPVIKPPTPPKPVTPPVPHPVVRVHDVKPPPPKVRPIEKPKLDQLAKLMEETPTDVTPPKPAPAPKAKPAPEATQPNHFDLTDITKLLSHSAPAPAQHASTAAASPAHDSAPRVASLGSPTASAAKMSPSFWAGLDGLLEDQYRQCWSYLGLTGGQKYIPQVRVVYSQSGSLEGEPVLINPPSDPNLRSLADSALRAVRRCNPLRIPDQYAPYYDQWKGRVLRFDPEEMAG